jgi:VWFA-related protein
MLRGLFLSSAILLASCTASAQDSAPAPQGPAQPTPTTTFQVQSKLVLVPTTVETKKGDVIYNLDASQFVLEDNGVRQRVRLEDTADGGQPLSLVVAAQCSRSEDRQAWNMRGLITMVDALLGGAPAEVAVIRFGSGSDLVSGFTHDEPTRNRALSQLQPCDDSGDTIFDAVDYANTLLDAHHAKGRRAILLISETRDHGSEMKADVVIRELTQTNTVLDAVSFLPAKTELADAVRNPGTGSGVIGLLFMAVEALRKNAPKEFAELSGGEYLNFTNQKGFERDLTTLTNHIHNYYLLSFTPRFPPDSKAAVPGLHAITVKVPEMADAVVRHRASYWAPDPNAPTPPPAP